MNNKTIMDFDIEKYSKEYLSDICEIWNEAIEEGLALPWTERFSEGKAEYIIGTQTECFCALKKHQCVGFYILHPNGSGRCNHIANALYIVKKKYRRQGVGTALVNHSLKIAREHSFMAMQYNSVVASNNSVHIYLNLGFETAGTIPNGFRLNENQYDDLLILYKIL